MPDPTPEVLAQACRAQGHVLSAHMADARRPMCAECAAAALTEQARERIPKACPICTVTDMICPECSGREEAGAALLREIGALQDKVIEQAREIERLTVRLNETLDTGVSRDFGIVERLVAENAKAVEQATWEAAAQEVEDKARRQFGDGSTALAQWLSLAFSFRARAAQGGTG